MIWNKWPFCIVFFVVFLCNVVQIKHFAIYNNGGWGKIKYHPDAVEYFKELPFYNKYIEKPKKKRIKDGDLLSELPFYEELNVIKTDHAFKGYVMSYKVELVEKKRFN